ncbi:unnamed protein product [Echinostoma caproni]|uniref:Ionotropic glutamate receptor C-terminal domain-containing protein n=1 Tax=Echinostoma caproni TaxID=27848 RepID=A0A3P8GPB6_9TREM|nr:unnamed protein product [Echinostoma caproni]
MTMMLWTKCKLYFLARSLDVGFFTVDSSECSFKSSYSVKERVMVPSIRHPKYAPVVVFNAFASAMQPNSTYDTLFILDNQTSDAAANPVTRHAQFLESVKRVRDSMFHVNEIKEPPFTVKTESGWTGFTIEVFENIAKKLNLRFLYEEQPRPENVTRDPTWDWTGIIERLHTKTADIGLGPIMSTDERRKLADFTIPYSETSGISMITLKKKQHDIAKTYFIDAFTVYVWVSVGAIILVSSFFLWVASEKTPYVLQKREQQTNGKPFSRIGFGDAVWLLASSAFGQGESVDPCNLSGKFVAGGLMVFIFYLYQLFIVSLIARMAVSSKTVNTVSVTSLVYNSDAKHYATAYNRMNQWGMTESHTQSLALVRQGWIVFMETLFAEYYVSQACDLQMIDAGFGSWNFGFLLQRNSPLTSVFDEA